MKQRYKVGPLVPRMCAYFLMWLAMLLIGNNLFSQNVQSKPSRQSSTEAFYRGDYEEALKEFRELLKIYPKDPLYKYYSGVCLVKLKMDPAGAANLLKEAQQGAAIVRSIPPDAIFWLGRAQQLSGDFTEAVSSYNTFIEQSGKKSARELGTFDFIQQCNEKKGQLSVSEPASFDRTGSEPVYSAKSNKILIDTLKNKKYENSPVPENYDKILSEALDYQSKADSIYKIVEEQKSDLGQLSYKEKTERRAIISEMENLASTNQGKADQKYDEAQAFINSTSLSMVKDPVKDIIPKPDSSFKSNLVAVTTTGDIGNGLKKDTTLAQTKLTKENNILEKAEKQNLNDAEVSTVKESEVSQAAKRPAEVFSVFEVIAIQNPSADAGIKVNPEVPPGLIYRIQTAVFRNPVAISYFRGLSPVYGFKAEGTDKTNYYVGMFRRAADANRALGIVRKAGFKDAFIVSFFSGKAISSERAALLEKEWGRKPLLPDIEPGVDLPGDTIPPALLFRVEVLRSGSPVKDDLLEGMKKIAGSRGLDIETLPDGIIVYLIGKFVTFESANEYSGLVIKNGYRDSKVVAWLGKKEIPVETAIKLFEKIE